MEQVEFNYDVLSAQHQGKLPKQMFGLNKKLVRAYEKEGYVCHIYNDSNKDKEATVSIGFFFYPNDNQWLAYIEWEGESNQFVTDPHTSWQNASREIQVGIANHNEEKKKLREIMTVGTDMELTPEQIVAILLME